jgi:hypothetical protein
LTQLERGRLDIRDILTNVVAQCFHKRPNQRLGREGSASIVGIVIRISDRQGQNNGVVPALEFAAGIRQNLGNADGYVHSPVDVGAVAFARLGTLKYKILPAGKWSVIIYLATLIHQKRTAKLKVRIPVRQVLQRVRLTHILRRCPV